MADDIEKIRSDGSALAVDCLYAEKTHFAYADALRSRANWLGAMTAVTSAIAGFGGLADLLTTEVIGYISLAAAIMAGLTTTLKPGETAEQHHSRGVEFNALRLRIRQFVRIETTFDQADAQKAFATLKLLMEDKIALNAQQPPTPSGKWYELAKAGIGAGESEYNRSEMEAAVGKAESGAAR